MTRWELALGVVLALATASWARPRIERATWRTRRAEAEMVLESLAELQEARVRAGKGALALAPFPRSEAAVDRTAVPWSGAPEGWVPPLDVARCAYRAEVAGKVRLVATCDVDGDGAPSVTSLVPGERAVRATAEEIY